MAARLTTFRPSWLPDRLPPRPEKPADRAGGDNREFYWSAEWRALRKVKAEMDPLCERCLAGGVTRLMAIVHHKLTVEERPDLRLDLGNLESLCGPCHNRAHGGRRPDVHE